MLLEHRGKSPDIHESAYVAPTATICGDVTIGENSRVLFGAVLAAEGGPIEVGNECVVMENAVVRSTSKHPVSIGGHVLIGPRSYLTGCAVEASAFLATGSTVFNGARIGTRTEVRINGVVQIKRSCRRTPWPRSGGSPTATHPRSCRLRSTSESGRSKNPWTFRERCSASSEHPPRR